MRGACQGPAQAAGARARVEEQGRGCRGLHRVSLSGSAPAFVHERVCRVPSGWGLQVSLCAPACKPCKPSLSVCCCFWPCVGDTEVPATAPGLTLMDSQSSGGGRTVPRQGRPRVCRTADGETWGGRGEGAQMGYLPSGVVGGGRQGGLLQEGMVRLILKGHLSWFNNCTPVSRVIKELCPV